MGIMESTKRNIRWWPFIATWGIGLLAFAILLWMNSGKVDGARQSLVMQTMGIAGLCFLCSLVWWVFFSRIPWKLRFAALGGFCVAGLVGASLFRYGGVSGDLVPIIVWRWTDTAEAQSTETPVVEVLIESDFPQFLGPNRNASVPGIRLKKDWSETPPTLLWRKPIGEAWSGFAVTDKKAITLEQDGEEEVVSCFDLLSGKVLWQARNRARYDNPLGGVGPRATPTIDGDRVYTVGATGFFACRLLSTGELVYSRNILEEHNAPLPDWGVAGSPLIFEDLVILSAGGPDGNSLVAYDKVSGELVWRGGSDKAHWSSPVAYEIEGEHQVLIFNKGGVAAHDIEDGSILWEFPWTKSTGTPRVAIPVQIPGNRFVISSGYGAGASMFQVTKSESRYVAKEKWKSLHLKSKFNNFVFRDGYLYGLDDGMLTCIDAETGRRTWKKGRYGHGQLLLGDDWLLLFAENGEGILMDPNPTEPSILGTFAGLEGKSWNPPALVGPFLLVRNHLEMACYQLPVEE